MHERKISGRYICVRYWLRTTAAYSTLKPKNHMTNKFICSLMRFSLLLDSFLFLIIKLHYYSASKPNKSELKTTIPLCRMSIESVSCMKQCMTREKNAIYEQRWVATLSSVLTCLHIRFWKQYKINIKENESYLHLCSFNNIFFCPAVQSVSLDRLVIEWCNENCGE